MASAPAPEPHDDPNDPLDELVRVHDGLRQAMIAFFQRNRVPDPEEYANEVFLRVLKKLRAGLKIERSVEQFCWRVARFVAQEQYRRRRFDDFPDDASLSPRSVLGLQDIEIGVLLNECMQALSVRDFDFARRYLHEDKEVLARELGTNRAAMAIRFYKIKRHLEEFVRKDASKQTSK